MARDSTGYAAQITALMPPGKAWSRDPASNQGLLNLALADEMARLDARGQDLINETDPRTTVEMIADWERNAGLPDPAIPAPTTLADRQAALCARLLTRGDQSDNGYLAIVSGFGFTGQIVTHTPFAADVSSADDLLYDDLSRFWFEITVTVPDGTTTPVVGLEHAIRRQLQLHTYVTFNYVNG